MRGSKGSWGTTVTEAASATLELTAWTKNVVRVANPLSYLEVSLENLRTIQTNHQRGRGIAFRMRWIAAADQRTWRDTPERKSCSVAFMSAFFRSVR